MSHELRTPLNAVLGFAQLLTLNPENNLSENQKKNAEHILKPGNHLLLLVNDVLDISRIEAGEFSIKMEQVELAPLVDEAVRLVQPMAKNSNIKIENLRTNENHISVRADSTRIIQALINLLSNAIKYNCENGSVMVSQTKVSEEKVQVNIHDTGKGIPKDKQSKIFETFLRLNLDNTNVDGVGIGLSITKQLINLMDGLIYLVSEMGKGSCFTIELPLAKPSSAN